MNFSTIYLVIPGTKSSLDVEDINFLNLVTFCAEPAFSVHSVCLSSVHCTVHSVCLSSVPVQCACPVCLSGVH